MSNLMDSTGVQENGSVTATNCSRINTTSTNHFNNDMTHYGNDSYASHAGSHTGSQTNKEGDDSNGIDISGLDISTEDITLCKMFSQFVIDVVRHSVGFDTKPPGTQQYAFLRYPSGEYSQRVIHVSLTNHPNMSLPDAPASISGLSKEYSGQSHSSGQPPTGSFGEITLQATASSQAQGSGGSRSRSPRKRAAGDRDGRDGTPTRRKKTTNLPPGQDGYHCIFFEIHQNSSDKDTEHPCKDKTFVMLEQLIDHHLRIHVKHLQCVTCLTRKGTNPDISKHQRAAGCSPPIKVRQEVITHGEDVHNANTWEELSALVAPGGRVVYDIVTGVDTLPGQWPPVGVEGEEPEQRIPPFQEYQVAQHVRTPYPSGPWNLDDVCLQISTVLPTSVDTSTTHHTNPEPGPSTLPPPQDSLDISPQHHTIIPKEISLPNLSIMATCNDMAQQFLDLQKDELGRQMAYQCARGLAFSLPSDVLEVITRVYQNRMASGGQQSAFGPTSESKGKERAYHYC